MLARARGMFGFAAIEPNNTIRAKKRKRLSSNENPECHFQVCESEQEKENEMSEDNWLKLLQPFEPFRRQNKRSIQRHPSTV